jgi:hypothetical protein
MSVGAFKKAAARLMVKKRIVMSNKGFYENIARAAKVKALTHL